MEQTDVLVVGAGPTGLVLALWLAELGIRPRIVDKAAQPGTTSRALAVHARTLELYRQAGIADAVIAEGNRSTGINMWTGGHRRARLPFDDVGRELTPYPFVLIYPQDKHERFLAERLRERGIEIERPVELLAFQDGGEGVRVRLCRADGSEEECAARYLAGCDGARSTVRHLLSADFEGGTYDQLFYVADVTVTGRDLVGEVHIAFEGPEFVLILPYGEPGKLRFVGTVRAQRIGEADSLGFEDVGHRAPAAMGLKVEQVNWFSTYRVHHRVTQRFRHGSAFLLGDAAHIHSPAGGQGMNTGIGDAVNLAWKLAAVLKDGADDSLLDTYHAERSVFARQLVDTTDRVFNLVSARGTLAELVRTRVAPRAAKLAWTFHPVREALFRAISQTMIDYPDSPLSVGKAGRVYAGQRLPFVRFDGRDNYAPLTTVGWQVHVYGTASTELREWCAGRGMPLYEFPWHAAFDQAGLARGAAYLLRPDGYIGLADVQGVGAALGIYLEDRGLRPVHLSA